MKEYTLELRLSDGTTAIVRLFTRSMDAAKVMALQFVPGAVEVNVIGFSLPLEDL